MPPQKTTDKKRQSRRADPVGVGIPTKPRQRSRRPIEAQGSSNGDVNQADSQTSLDPIQQARFDISNEITSPDDSVVVGALLKLKNNLPLVHTIPALDNSSARRKKPKSTTIDPSNVPNGIHAHNSYQTILDQHTTQTSQPSDSESVDIEIDPSMRRNKEYYNSEVNSDINLDTSHSSHTFGHIENISTYVTNGALIPSSYNMGSNMSYTNSTNTWGSINTSAPHRLPSHNYNMNMMPYSDRKSEEIANKNPHSTFHYPPQTSLPITPSEISDAASLKSYKKVTRGTPKKVDAATQTYRISQWIFETDDYKKTDKSSELICKASALPVRQDSLDYSSESRSTAQKRKAKDSEFDLRSEHADFSSEHQSKRGNKRAKNDRDPLMTPEEWNAFLLSTGLSNWPWDREDILRVGTYLFDEIFSHSWAVEFVSPVPAQYAVYHNVIKKPMDLTTAEKKLWAGDYVSLLDLYADLCQILYNAWDFHRPFAEKSDIFTHAKKMSLFLEDFIRWDVNQYIDYSYLMSTPHPGSEQTAAMKAHLREVLKLPHEKLNELYIKWGFPDVHIHVESPIYILSTLSADENKSPSRGLLKHMLRPEVNASCGGFNPLNRIMKDTVARRIDVYGDSIRSIHAEDSIPSRRIDPTQSSRNFIRLYISGGRESLQRCRDESDAILLILSDIKFKYDIHEITCKALIAKPFGDIHQLPTIEFPELFDVRYWIKCIILDRIDMTLIMSSAFQHRCLKSAHKVTLYAKHMVQEHPERHDAFIDALRLTQHTDNLTESQGVMGSIKLEAAALNVPFENFQSMGGSLKVETEGFFKRVFHVHGDDSYVVQNFKEITEQTFGARIVETVCCLKTKGVENTGQIRSIYTGAEDELVGLSMKRYQYTLKDYAFNSRRHLTAEQKYKLVLDMVKGVRAIHNAGFAHRDLSEVNIMVTERTDQKLLDGSNTPELVIIDFGKAEFVRPEDVMRWKVKEISSETLNLLPLIQTGPDHGYLLYRSIATLPRTKNDQRILPTPIDPLAEDIYSLGVLIWRTFSGQAPWDGILDSDLKSLRGIVSDAAQIRFYIEKSIRGQTSRELLLRCITVKPQTRNTAETLFRWLSHLDVKEAILKEWTELCGRPRKERII
ncbi:289_t:CDS:2 [Paraglomus brasilianum]|uniref:non-specific serine/threonine protein kinase n=1 Tax=Paraglomus brasilianum TaxID=144538 RepID=A0A9N9EXL6_9GLOM|nr:289_t:CDS:2 [Paraglomus brasilianum]